MTDEDQNDSSWLIVGHLTLDLKWKGLFTSSWLRQIYPQKSNPRPSLRTAAFLHGEQSRGPAPRDRVAEREGLELGLSLPQVLLSDSLTTQLLPHEKSKGRVGKEFGVTWSLMEAHSQVNMTFQNRKRDCEILWVDWKLGKGKAHGEEWIRM